MGVDWYACNNCGETFPDCGDYTGCECGEHWCSDECAEVEGFRREEDGYKPAGQSWEQESSCSYCRKEDHSDSTLLDYCLQLIGKTREQIIVEYNSKS